jgi:osmotically-inducible protein OsmY
MTDRELLRNIEDELEIEPMVNASNIGVAVNAGVVTLTGHVRTLAEKSAVDKAVQRVKGVRAIAEEIEILPEAHARPSDEELAHRALNILQWDATIPNEGIQLMVQHGVVTLSGEVTWQCHRTAVEDAVRRLYGVTAIVNNIALSPRAEAGNIREIVQDALSRNVGVDATGVRVSLRAGNIVLLEGTVRSLAERKAAEDAAWCALGIMSVDNRLTLSGETAH